MRKLLYIDTSYNFEEIEKRKSLNVILVRDLDSFFSKVISIHPVADLTNNKLFLKNNHFFKENFINNHHTFFEFKSKKKSKIFILEIFYFIFFQIKMVKFLINLIKNEGITDIKCGDINYAGLLGYILFKLTKVNYFLRVGSNNDKIRDVINRPLQPKFFRKVFIEKYFEKLILKNSSHIFPANYDNANFIKSYLNNSNKITVVRYGQLINDCHYLERNKRKITSLDLVALKNKTQPIITCIARFEKVKKVDDVIKVFERLIKNNNKLILVLVGDGSLLSNYSNLIDELGISKNVFLAGNKNQKWISELLAITDLVLSPHTGRALCEASLAGSKIVGYDIDWQSEIIEHNINGFLVKYGDIGKLFYYAEEIINNKSKYEKFAVNIREKALKILDKKKNIIDEVNIINK